MAITEYNTMDLSLEEVKVAAGEAQNMARWGFKFSSPPPALGKPLEGFYVGFQTGSFPQETITYLEERLGNFPVSWVGEVTRNGEIAIGNIESENMEFTDYLNRWVNLMGAVTDKKSTHTSVKTKDVEATAVIFLMEGTKGDRTLEFTLKFCKPMAQTAPSGSNTPALFASGFSLKYDTFVRGVK